MELNASLARIDAHLTSRLDLLRRGASARDIAASVSEGRLHRLLPGWYAPAPFWTEADAPTRQLTLLSALRRSPRPPPIFSHLSAATLHELPVWSGWLGWESAPDPGLAHVLVRPGARGNAAAAVMRHRSSRDPADVTQLRGFSCTTPDRTLLDLARTVPFPVALAAADAVLAQSVRRGSELDLAAWQEWRARLLERARGLTGSRGVRAVRALAHLAHPLADSPLESVSRLRLLQLGIDVELQFPVASESGGTYRVDFRFAGLEVFGECDGSVKYREPEFLRGRSLDAVIESERRRYNWICGVTGMRGVRWGAREARTANGLAGHLRACHVPFPGRATRRFGPEVADFLDRLPRGEPSGGRA